MSMISGNLRNIEVRHGERHGEKVTTFRAEGKAQRLMTEGKNYRRIDLICSSNVKPGVEFCQNWSKQRVRVWTSVWNLLIPLYTLALHTAGAREI